MPVGLGERELHHEIRSSGEVVVFGEFSHFIASVVIPFNERTDRLSSSANGPFNLWIEFLNGWVKTESIEFSDGRQEIIEVIGFGSLHQTGVCEGWEASLED